MARSIAGGAEGAAASTVDAAILGECDGDSNLTLVAGGAVRLTVPDRLAGLGRALTALDEADELLKNSSALCRVDL